MRLARNRILGLAMVSLAKNVLLAMVLLSAVSVDASASEAISPLPVDLSVYETGEAEAGLDSLSEILWYRASTDPFNLIATLLFFGAILHTFQTGYFRALGHRLEMRHRRQQEAGWLTDGEDPYNEQRNDASLSAAICHFLGEVEAVFGIWIVPLIGAIVVFHGWDGVTGYFDALSAAHKYTEPMFVVVIMAVASSRPVLKAAETTLRQAARLGKSTPAAWWLAILTVTPLLGSFITEPAAMTIAALLLAKLVFSLEPSLLFRYASLGLLFVNVSVGGTLTHFAAPPILMVAERWNWDTAFVFTQFGWKAALGIVIANSIYAFHFRQELTRLRAVAATRSHFGTKGDEPPVPPWVTALTLLFIVWTVINLHHPPLLVGGFLFFLAFILATRSHHDDVRLRGPLLVGFFLAGLVTHGALQQWWIAPVLSRLGELPLFLGSTLLTAFNDNAAITYLASTVPSFDWQLAEDPATARALEYAVITGAVTGGGLTVIANAPNPAGQNILQPFFGNGIAPQKLLVAAALPTAIMAMVFLLL